MAEPTDLVHHPHKADGVMLRQLSAFPARHLFHRSRRAGWGLSPYVHPKSTPLGITPLLTNCCQCSGFDLADSRIFCRGESCEQDRHLDSAQRRRLECHVEHYRHPASNCFVCERCRSGSVAWILQPPRRNDLDCPIPDLRDVFRNRCSDPEKKNALPASNHPTS